MDSGWILTAFAVLSAAAAGDVPVLMWSQSRSMSDFPQVFAGKSIDTNNLYSHYFIPLITTGPTTLVVFLQDQLSLNHFTQYADVYSSDSDGGAFRNVKNFMDSHFSVSLPLVHDPATAVGALKKAFPGNVLEIRSPYNLESLQLKQGESNLLLVQLPDIAGTIDEETALAKNDEIIAKVLKELDKGGLKYTVLYTAAQSTQPITEPYHKGRKLLATDQRNSTNSTGIFFNETKCAFYAKSIYLELHNVTAQLEELVTFSQTVCDSNDTSKFIFTLTTNDPNISVSATIMMDIMVYEEYDWTISNISVEYSGKIDSSKIDSDRVFMKVPDSIPTVPRTFSYHCSEPPAFNESTGNKSVSLHFHGLQIQPFGFKGKFSGAWDCVGFFNIGILMGLFSTLIGILIIAFGLCMMMNIKSMDRFDDPKGKTITVTATD